MRAAGPTLRGCGSSKLAYPHAVSEPLAGIERLRPLLYGFRSTQVIYVFAKLGLADFLAVSPLTAAELASRVGANQVALGRVLRLAAYYGLVSEVPDQRFELTALGRVLSVAVEGSMKAPAIMLGEGHYGAWGALLHTVMTGEPAFDHVHGAPFFDYMAMHPEVQATFDAAMAAANDVLLGAMVDGYDFSAAALVVDVGGGNGSLSAIVLRRHPTIEAIIYDQPQVLEAANRYLTEAGVRSRCRLVPGNFFDSIPEGGDVYLLSNIVHDWDDERATRILRNCRSSMQAAAAVLLLETVLPEHGHASAAAMADVNMMVLLAGRERTKEQYRKLLEAADLRMTRVIPISERESLIEARTR